MRPFIWTIYYFTSSFSIWTWRQNGHVFPVPEMYGYARLLWRNNTCSSIRITDFNLNHFKIILFFLPFLHLENTIEIISIDRHDPKSVFRKREIQFSDRAITVLNVFLRYIPIETIHYSYLKHKEFVKWEGGLFSFTYSCAYGLYRLSWCPSFLTVQYQTFQIIEIKSLSIDGSREGFMGTPFKKQMLCKRKVTNFDTSRKILSRQMTILYIYML